MDRLAHAGTKQKNNYALLEKKKLKATPIWAMVVTHHNSKTVHIRV